MGVKGLQYFLDRCCPEACVSVDLREMAARHAASTVPTSSPTIAVDGMACLCHWYSCKDWVCGGQWREYMDILKRWVDTFTTAGIRLVFFFDGVIEEQKRQEWVKRRRRVNGEVSKIFRYIKAHGEQPGGNVFSLPSGLATFTRFALRLLGQEVFCSMQEADYEIASYARRQGCMGILGQDTDFIIYDSAPYLSVTKLSMDSLTTILYDREIFCRSLGLTVTQLPLLACLLGNDVVSEERMQHIRNKAMAEYRKKHHAPHSGASREQMVFAVSQLVSTLCCSEGEETVHVPQSLHLSAADRQLLQRGICSYILTGQRGDVSALSSGSGFEKYVSPEILKACREKHVAAEGFMVYNVICEGVVECSNSLEDEEDGELLPQAVVFRPCRQNIYSLLLLNKPDGSTEEPPAVREWFVYPGNPLKEPDVVQPVPISFPCSQPSLDVLWFSSDPNVSALRLMSFFSTFGCQEFSELHGAVEDSLLVALCLVTYIVLQVPALSVEDVDAYLSQAVCVRLKSPLQLQQLKLPFVSGRAVQLGSLYVRGLSHLLGANCASGGPLPSDALMPWRSFDGRLFHSKYLLAHGGSGGSALLDDDPSCLTQFRHLREKLLEACGRRGRVLQSRPRTGRPSPAHTHEHRHADGPAAGPPGGGEDWRRRGDMAAGRRGGSGRRGGGGGRPGAHQNPDRPRERGGHRGGGWGAGGGGGEQFYSCSDGGLQNLNPPSRPPRGRWHPSRGRYRLAPRWPRPPEGPPTDRGRGLEKEDWS